MKKSISNHYSSSKGSFNDRLRKILSDTPDIAIRVSDASLFTDIALRLHSLRKKRGLLQKDLAKCLGIQQSNVSKYETPGYDGYTLKLLRRYLRELDADLDVKIVEKGTPTVVHRKIDLIYDKSRYVYDENSMPIKIGVNKSVVSTFYVTNKTEGELAWQN